MEDIIIEERPVPSVSKKEPVKVVEKKVKIKVKKQGPGVLSYLADWFNKSLIVFLLAALDFILFCGRRKPEYFSRRAMGIHSGSAVYSCWFVYFVLAADVCGFSGPFYSKSACGRLCVLVCRYNNESICPV